MATDKDLWISSLQTKWEREKKSQIQCTVALPEFIKKGYTILLNKSAG